MHLTVRERLARRSVPSPLRLSFRSTRRRGFLPSFGSNLQRVEHLGRNSASNVEAKILLEPPDRVFHLGSYYAVDRPLIVAISEQAELHAADDRCEQLTPSSQRPRLGWRSRSIGACPTGRTIRTLGCRGGARRRRGGRWRPVHWWRSVDGDVGASPCARSVAAVTSMAAMAPMAAVGSVLRERECVILLK